ncbi:MAG: NADH-quinone oxidoreductase subunit J [Candidatus Calescibacterium sp.]|nr:NADH-quinone oxidoreductase subunit J [Candidatus Calescibacterium sp.]MCX7971879.1 NADH-quinone oxidoreductase subunit J [bacterium]MDW8195022.1 NADH-quinone oxidoreductase subunit J [Candidatus Calescibacterium sp.]
MLAEILYLALLLGVLVLSLAAVFSREIFKAAVSLVFAFIFLSAIYLLLGAEFLAVIQLIIYAGAIAILILFAIMHTPARIEKLGDTKIFDYKPHYINAFLVGSIIFLALLGIGILILSELNLNVNNYKLSLVDFANALFNIKDIQNYGGRFVLVFELAGILILASVIAAITVAKKE